MSLQKALGWSGLGAAVKIALGFFSAKVSAIYLGPAGMVLVGQINNFMQVTAGAIGNGANTAVVNLTAQRATARETLPEIWAAAMRLVVALAGVVALVVALAAGSLSHWLFFSREYWPVVLVAGLVMVLAVAENVLTGALNGLKQVNAIARATVVSSFVEFGLFVSLTCAFGVWGALLAMTCVYITRLAISCVIAHRSRMIRRRDFVGRLNLGALKEIVGFYPMLLAHSIALPLGLLLVRGVVVRELGLQQGGYLQAAWRLSDVYVTVLTTALGLYFMAQYSSLEDESTRGAMLRRTILQVTAVTATAAVGIYLLRDVVVRVVLTREFLPMTLLLPFQLLGDVFKMACYPLQMALVSRRRSGVYIAQAIGAPMAYALFTYVSLARLGLRAAPIAYASAYAVVFVALVIALRSTLTVPASELVSAKREQLAA
jgi:polysaccharide transporter, PST family